MGLVVDVYQITKRLPKSEIYGLSNQARRAAVSVPVNIAEGHARSSRRDFASFLYIAKGSLMELETLLQIMLRLGYVTEKELAAVFVLVSETGRMLSTLIARLKDAAPERQNLTPKT